MSKVAGWLLLGVVVFCAYANTLDNGFVFDDYFMVLENEALRLPPPEWLTIFRGANNGVGSYRPLRTLSYAIDYQIGGLQPFIYHFSNIIYHWLAACLVFLLAFQMVTKSGESAISERDSSALKIALGAALLWALHPVQTDSVAYISGRRDILAGLFFFLGFYAFLRLRTLESVPLIGRQLGWILVVFFAFLFGALAKEAVFVLPLVFFAHDCCREYKPDRGFLRSVFHTAWCHKWFYGPLLTVAIGAFVYYAPYFPHILQWHGEGPLTTWATVPRIWLHYVALLLFPLTLTADYSNAFPLSTSFFELRTLGAIAGVGVLVAGTVWGLRQGYRLAAFCGLWFMITLLPVSHLLPHQELVAEHYLYIPSFGFCLLIVLGLAQLILGPESRVSSQQSAVSSQRSAYWRRMVGYGIFAALLVFYSARTIVRNGDWQNEVTLWQKTVETAPTSARAHHNLGVALYQEQEWSAAEQAFRQAITADPTYGAAYTGLAEIYLASFQFDDALAMAQKGVELRPRRVWAYWVLGLVHFRRGEYSQAIAVFQKVVALKKDFLAAHALIIQLYRTIGEEEKAREWQQRFPPSHSPQAALLPKGFEGRESPASPE
jgi:Flp pilus assembly protein TadD